MQSQHPRREDEIMVLVGKELRMPAPCDSKLCRPFPGMAVLESYS